MPQPIAPADKPIKERLEKAIMTLHALPHGAHTKPLGHKSAWPDMIRQAKRGAILHRGSIPFRPNNADISDCYDIIDALYDLSEMQRLLIAHSWKDEAWTICFIIILGMCFVPALQIYVAEGFAILEETPHWFQWACLASIGASFGLRGFDKFQQKSQSPTGKDKLSK